MRCSKCETENREGRKFCAKCGSPLARRCPGCGASNEPAEDFCGECGSSLITTQPVAVQSSTAIVGSDIRIAPERPDASVDGERKTVTALFADIKGSMDLMEDLDPEEARAIVDPALKLMMDSVHHYGGYVAQSTGDGIFALFGAPIAHEDHPQRAIYAALRMQEELRRHSDRTRAEGGLPIQVRVGVNTGEVVVRSVKTSEARSEYTPIGHSISLAARMQVLASIGSTATTEQVKKLCDGYFVFKSLGPTKVKGVAEPVNVYEVTGFGPLRTRLQRSAVRGYTKFVGRQREMDAMKAAAEQAMAGHGQIVAAVAEPGVGKSRLVYEFKIKNQSGWMVLEALSVSHGKASAYLPLIDLLYGYFKITGDDDSRTRREKVTGRVIALDRNLEDALPQLFALIGIVEGDDPLAEMDARVGRRRTHEAIKRILLRESLNQPLIVIFEDLHWIDEQTQEFLNLLADSIGTARILLLVNYRPEYSHQWNSKTYYTQLRLDPLGRESAGQMLSALLGDGAELTPLKRLIIERTEGTPFFMEETVQMLLDDGSLARNGTIRLARPLIELKIPTTVQAILAARIDRLTPAAKELVQTLAVIGREFPLSLVRAVVGKSDDELSPVLNDLQLGEFVYEQPAIGDTEYIFKHALTQEVAYNSLLTERRRFLHERTGQVIEALYRERLEEHYADLGRHYSSSNNVAKAVEYLRLSGEQMVDRGAYVQASAEVELGLRLIQQLPEEEQRLRAELSMRLIEVKIVPVLYGMASEERLRTSERVCELSTRLRDNSALIGGLLNLGFAYLNSGQARRGAQTAARCLALENQTQDAEIRPYVHLLAAWSAYRSGDLLQALSRFNDLVKWSPSRPQRVPPGVTTLSACASASWMLSLVQVALGRPDSAVKLADESLRTARELNHPFGLATALMAATYLRHQRREPEAMRALAKACIALAEEHGFNERLAEGRWFRDWALNELDPTEQGVTELAASVAGVSGFPRLMASVALAELYLHIGHPDKAIVLLDEEGTRIEQWGGHLQEPELYGLKGEAILMRDSSATAAAEVCFRKAIEVARSQSAKWWQLRATMSLARLLAKQGRRDEARAMLAEIYNWFTEGFDTADLKEAKALLDELNRGAS